jgi:hypothetical protein
MTDQELRDYSEDHLYYELWMWYETGSRLVHQIAKDTDGDFVLKNAFVESFAIHSRSLAAFLYDKGRKDDVTADNYVQDVDEWWKARGPKPQAMEVAATRASKEIVHLTTKRLPPGAPDKVWDPEEIVRAFCVPLKRFAENVPDGRLSVSVTAFIRDLPSPPRWTTGKAGVDPSASTVTSHSPHA